MFLLLSLTLYAPAFASDDVAPRRIVSLNMCLDILLVQLVPRERIAAISHYSRDPWRTTIGPIGQELPITYETAEEVVALQPDLVLTSRHSAPATRHALKRVGIRFELFDVPMTIEKSREQVRRLAALLHEEARGEELVARIDAAVESARPKRALPVITAAVYQPGGLTAGAGTITDELMSVAGLTNVPTQLDVQQHRWLSMELLLSHTPDILFVGETPPIAVTHAERIVQHRAIRSLETRMHRETYPAKLIYCAGSTMIHALDVLVTARERALQSMTQVQR
ncbi:MAG: ABC transporter substrate-binding protein [Steroidobacteraceae bacterium]